MQKELQFILFHDQSIKAPRKSLSSSGTVMVLPLVLEIITIKWAPRGWGWVEAYVCSVSLGTMRNNTFWVHRWNAHTWFRAFTYSRWPSVCFFNISLTTKTLGLCCSKCNRLAADSRTRFLRKVIDWGRTWPNTLFASVTPNIIRKKLPILWCWDCPSNWKLKKYDPLQNQHGMPKVRNKWVYLHDGDLLFVHSWQQLWKLLMKENKNLFFLTSSIRFGKWGQ